MYKVKYIEGSGAKLTREEVRTMDDLIKVLPTLKKHKLDEPVMKHVRKTRAKRKEKTYTLEVSRKVQGIEHKQSCVIDNPKTKMKKMKELRDKVVTDIRKFRQDNRAKPESVPMPHNIKSWKMYGEIHLEPGTFARIFDRKIRDEIMLGARKPNSTDNYIGIEIEFICKKDREYLAERMIEAGVGKYISIGTDGSVRAQGDWRHTGEMRILVRESEYVQVMEKICAVLNTDKLAIVNESCGLHVHMDMRSRDAALAYNNLLMMQNVMFAMNHPKRQTGGYSRPLPLATKFGATTERYSGVNQVSYSKYKTIELRMHSGSTDPTKIINWITLIAAIVNSPKIEKPVKDVTALQKHLKIADGLVSYIKMRIAKFAKAHEANIAQNGKVDALVELAPVTSDVVDTTLNELGDVA